MPPTATLTDETRTVALVEVIETIQKYARRYVVNSANPADVIVFDAAIQVAIDHGAHLRSDPAVDALTSACAERRATYGIEQITEPFRLPVTLDDVTVVIHRYARLYTNGRGTYTAAIINDAAREMLRLGTIMDATRRRCGSIWAADGQGGTYDTLSAAERAEALATLPGR